jgi:hypothetical protein
VLEVLNDPATGPGGRTRDEDALHWAKSREAVLPPANRGGSATSCQLRARTCRRATLSECDLPASPSAIEHSLDRVSPT